MAEATFEPTPSDVEPDGMLAYFKAIQNPDRNDPNWPLPSFNAKDWAEDFCRRFMIMKRDGHKTAPVDDDTALMIGWFANALMRGFDEAQLRAARFNAEHPNHPRDPGPSLQ